MRVAINSIPLALVMKSLWFTIKQSIASTVLALIVGLPGAWLAARFRFPGRDALLVLSAIPFCFPPILVILAFVTYYGNQGMLWAFLSSVLGVSRQYHGVLYSFWGLAAVHAFYNFPIVIHQVSALWMRIPESQEEAARMLGARNFRHFVQECFLGSCLQCGKQVE